jgi:hypothetical protein
LYLALLERDERLIEGTAARTNERDLVDDKRRPRQHLVSGDGRLQHDRAARPHQP